MGRMWDALRDFEALPREGKLEILVPADNFKWVRGMTVGMEDAAPLMHFTTKEMQAPATRAPRATGARK